MVTIQSWALFHWSGLEEIDGLLRQSPNLLPARPCRDVVGLCHIASGAAVRQGEGCAVAKEALSGARKGRGANMALNVFSFLIIARQYIQYNDCHTRLIVVEDWRKLSRAAEVTATGLSFIDSMKLIFKKPLYITWADSFCCLLIVPDSCRRLGCSIYARCPT